MTTEPCPRGCGKPAKPRHTCIDAPTDDERTSLTIRALRDTAAFSRGGQTMRETRARTNARSVVDAVADGLESGRLRIVEADTDPHGCRVTEEMYEAAMSELEECQRKAGHYHAQRVEADERNAKLEDLLQEAVAIAESVPLGRKTNATTEYASRFAVWLPRAKELLQ